MKYYIVNLSLFIRFKFSVPKEKISVQSQLLKQKTNELYFTASFELQREQFSTKNLLYLLTIYPLHTRIIQLWIHIEAIKLWWKGVPLYPHPDNADVDFGFGITGKRIFMVLNIFIQPIWALYGVINKLRGLT